MIYKKIGETGLCPSAICLGTDDFGSVRDKHLSFDIMDKYYEQGGNVLDTARLYGSWAKKPDDMSENTVGAWVKERGLRDKIIISTKCAHPPVGYMDMSRLSRDEIVDDVNASLRALQTDYIDILWLHRDDVNHPIADIMNTISDVVKSGKVRCVGVSNWGSERIDMANTHARACNQPQLVASQIKWSVGQTSPDFSDDPTLVEMDETEYEYYKMESMPVFAYAPQAKGFFSKYHDGGAAALSEKAAQRYLWSKNLERYEQIKAIADGHAVPVSSVVLAYITSCYDFDGFAIVGCKSPEQVADSLWDTDLILSKQEMDRLNI